jgi:putative hydrolase of the HAD superfamily
VDVRGLKAVLLDAMGTLVRLEPPAPPLRDELAARFGLQVTEEEARAAIAAEIAYYRAHHDEGRDAASLAALRERCADALRGALPAAGRELPLPEVTAALLAALRFTAYPDVPVALEGLGAAGVRRVVVSNWDVSLHEVLDRVGLGQRLLDGVLTSAEAGVAKPDPRIFHQALELAGVDADDALHVGDTVADDVEGARAAGIRGLLLVREGEPPVGIPTASTLTALLDA